MIPFPPAVAALVLDAETTARRLEQARKGFGFDRFIASDPAAVWTALNDPAVPRGRFLEWGSGLGLVTLLAAAAGWDAHGIDVDATLVSAARGLARRHGLAATFVEGDLFPRGYEPDPEVLDDDCMHDASGPDAYAALGLDLADFDVIYVFPWSGEEALFEDLFHRRAAADAVLMENLGSDGIRLLRRPRDRR